MPVFARRLRMKNLGHGVRRPGCLQDAVGLAAERIGRVAVRERKIVGREAVLVVLAVRPRRRGKPLVEKAQAAAGDVRDHAIQHLSALLIGIEAVPQKMPQAAAALRRAKRQRPIHQRLAILPQQRVLLARAILQRRHDIANSRQPRPLHQRPFGLIHDFINPARLQAARRPPARSAATGPTRSASPTTLLTSFQSSFGISCRGSASRSRRVTFAVGQAALGRLIAPLIAAMRKRRPRHMRDRRPTRSARSRGSAGRFPSPPALAAASCHRPAAPPQSSRSTARRTLAGRESRRRPASMIRGAVGLPRLLTS